MTEEDYDRVFKMINEPKKEEKNVPEDAPPVDTMDISSKNRYQLYNHQARTNQKAPKVTRKQLPFSKTSSPYFVDQQKNQEEVKPVLSNSPNNGRRYFTVIYGKDKPNKKHKVFSDDGYLIVMDKVVEFRDEKKKL